MGFEIPGIGYDYTVKYVNSNWRKKRKIQSDNYGLPIVAPTVTNQPYSYCPLIPPTEVYDFNMLYTDDWNIRLGMDEGRDCDLRARRNSVFGGFNSYDMNIPEDVITTTAGNENNKSLVSNPLQINTSYKSIKSEAAENMQMQSTHVSGSVKKLSTEKKLSVQEPQKPKQLVNLPTEILLRIVALSKNVPGLLQTCRFFFDFVVLHQAHIYRLLIEYYYLNKIKCSVTFGSIIKANRLTDEEHIQNSMAFTIEDMEKRMKYHQEQQRKRRRSSVHYQSKDIIIVLDSECLLQPFMSYKLFRAFTIDAILPAFKIKQLRSEVEHSVGALQQNLLSSYQTTFVGTDRLNKAEVLKKFVNESEIPFPYLDPSNPSNLDYLGEDDYVDKLRLVKKIMLLHPKFENILQDIVYFLIELNIKVKEVMPSDVEFNDIRLKLKDMKVLIGDQVEHLGVSQDDTSETDGEDKKKFVITSPELVLSILMKAGKKWSKSLLKYVSRDALQENEHFWTCIMESKRLDYVKWLEKYAHLSPSAGVLNILARNSQGE